MESIKFYKLISPYQEDVTLNCKLTMADMDDNFLAFKDNDISGATYDNSSMIIEIVKNNGEKIGIDISEFREEVENKIEEATSGLTSGSTTITLNGNLSNDGTLTLSWTDSLGEHETAITGFLTESFVKHDSTLSGNGSNQKPLRISNTELTGKYQSVLGIVDTLPTENLQIGDRWIIKQQVSSFGRLYSKQGFELVKASLEENASGWRVPTKEDWDKLLTYTDTCGVVISGNTVGEYQGEECGKNLKTEAYWEGNENVDKYGFSVLPTGFVKDGALINVNKDTRFWTNTEHTEGVNYIKGFHSNEDGVLQDIEHNNEWYSIRLVRDIDNEYPNNPCNILGAKYNLIMFTDIQQAWTETNISFNPGLLYSEQYDYYGSGILSEIYVLCHWNGNFWEKKQLNTGDSFSVTSDNTSIEYHYIEGNDKTPHLIKGPVYKFENGIGKCILDAGWY
jgi:uncharacterized protein (TIGR02145 family)